MILSRVFNFSKLLYTLLTFTLFYLFIFCSDSNSQSNKLKTPHLKEKHQSDIDDFSNRLKKVSQEEMKNSLNNMRQNINNITGSHYATTDDILKMSEIEDEARRRIQGYKEGIKRMILETASAIEDNREVKVTEISGSYFTEVTERQASTLKEAFSRNSISLRSLSLSIQMYCELSKDQYNKATNEQDPDKKYKLYIEYTAFVYELSAIVIELIEDFRIEGIAELNNIHRNRKIEVDKIKDQIKDQRFIQKQRLDKNEITEDDFSKSNDNYNNWEKALEASLNHWDNIFAILSDQEKWADNICGKLNHFKNLKMDAGIQLAVLRETMITKGFLEHLSGLQKIVEVAAKVPLLPLDESIVYQLIGYDAKIDNL